MKRHFGITLCIAAAFATASTAAVAPAEIDTDPAPAGAAPKATPGKSADTKILAAPQLKHHYKKYWVTAVPAQKREKKLVPLPPKLSSLYSKVASLWLGNRMLYCDSFHAIDQTISEIRKLHGVKKAGYDIAAAEINIRLTDGSTGAIDVADVPKPAEHPNCIKE